MSHPRSRRRSPFVVIGSIAMILGLANLALAALPTVDDGAITSASDTHGHNHAQHGETDGHLDMLDSGNIELIGRMRINQDQTGRASDVGVLGNYAYIGAFAEPRCQKGGVYVFDISNPERPKQVNFIRTGGNSYVGEGVQAISIDTEDFTGDVLVMNNEICGAKDQPSTVGGVTLVDVTDPKRHRILAAGVGDTGGAGGLAHQSHSAFMWTTEDAAYAVIIDNEESADLDILDISDPRNPELIAEYDLNADFPGIIDAVKGDAESFSHDMIVKEVDGSYYMLASYWDGGYVVLDVTDPVNPELVGDTDFAAIDEQLFESTGLEEVPEGNAHQAEFTLDNAYFIGADEDFGPFGTLATADDVPFTGASTGSNTPPLGDVDSITGETVFVGRACSPISVTPEPGQIAVAERGDCFFTDKVANIEAAGDWEAIIIFNREGSDACTGTGGMSVAGNTPTFGIVGRDTGFDFFGQAYDDTACEAGSEANAAPITIGLTGKTVHLESYFDGWGYVRLFGNEPDGNGKFPLLDTYAIPEAHDPGYAHGFGDLSVHEVATSPTDPSLMYFAYYAGGFRVVRITDDEKLEEVGAWIGPGGNNFWGVQVWTPEEGEYAGEELVLASDRDYGVYIFRYTGDDAGD